MRIEHVYYTYESETIMARPKKLTAAKRLNLLLNGVAKKRIIQLAFERKISAGQLFETLVNAEFAKGNGDINGQSASLPQAQEAVPA
jgi:hypothetical protein